MTLYIHIKPYQQGELDGFCGVYSIVNAVHYLCGPLTSTEAEKLMLKVMRFLEPSLPTIRRLSYGTVKREILYVIHHMILKQYPVCLLKPFYRNKGISLDILWSDISAFLATHRGVVFICLEGKYDHWSLVRKITPNCMLLFDSAGLHRIYKRYCTIDDIDGYLHIIYPSQVMYLWVATSPGGSDA